MAYENYKLTYDKDWSVEDPESELYFPTVETDETKVRQDLQLLFNNVKTALNNLIDALDDSSGAANTKITEISGTAATNVQAALEDVFDDLPGLMSAKHTHSNKALLDSYNQTNTAIATAIQYKHQHVNMNVLNSLDATVKEAYDRLVNLLGSITSVTTDISSSGTNAQVPTALAVRSLVLGIPNLDKIFVAVKDTTTYAQVQQAVAAGKAVFAYDGTNLYNFCGVVGTTYIFTSLLSVDMLVSVTVAVKDLWLQSDNTWVAHSNNLAPIASPTFTGTPQITTTPTTGDDSHKVADTAFVQQEIAANPPDLSAYATLDSPALTGTPTAPTAVSGTNTTQLATTAFVHSAAAAVDQVAIVDYDTASEELFNTINSAYTAGKRVVIKKDVSYSASSSNYITEYEFYELTDRSMAYSRSSASYYTAFTRFVFTSSLYARRGNSFSNRDVTVKTLVLTLSNINGSKSYDWADVSCTPTASSADEAVATKKYVDDAIAAALANL